MSIAWESVWTAFLPDGAYRDIYVTATTLEDWNKLLRLLRDSGYSVRLTVKTETGEVEIDLPSEFKSLRSLTFHCLRITLSPSIEITVHDWEDGDIVLTADPKEITGQQDLDAVTGLMRELGLALNREVRLSEEGWGFDQPDDPTISFDPETDEFTVLRVDDPR